MYKFKIHQDRFDQITQRGVENNAKLSPSGRDAAINAMAALSAYQKVAIIATMRGRTELTEHIESRMNKILDNYDANCLLDCCA